MSRMLKFAALAAAAFLLLLLAAGTVVHARVDPNHYKNDIVQLVQERHQRTLAIPGTMSLTFWPRIGADLGRVTLSERASADQFAAIDNARISVALLPLLLRQQVVVDRVDIRGVRARVLRLADGSMSTGDLTSAHMAQGASTGGGAGRAPVQVAIASIRVHNAQVLFDDRRSARQYQITHLNIDSGPIARGAPSRMKLSANVALNRPALSTALTLTARFMPSLAQRRVTFSEVDANLDLSFKDARVKLGGSIDVDLDRDEFSADLTGRFDDSVFDLKTGYRADAYHMTAHIDRIDLDRYQNRLVPDALPDDPAILEAGDAFDLSPLSMLRASGGVHVGELKVGTLHAANVRAALRSGGGKFVLEPIGASVYGGAGTGAVTLDFARSASTPHMTFIGALKGINVAPLLQDLIGATPIAGRGDVAIDLSTHGASTAQMRQALAGTASAQLVQGSVNGVDIGRMVQGARAASGSASSADQTPFTRLGASFTVAGGIAHNADLALDAPLFSLSGAGDIDIGRKQLDYTLTGGQGLAVRIGGPWDALAWRVEPQTVSGAAVRQKAGEKLNKAIRGILKR